MLVGRAGELAAVERVLHRAERGAGGVLVFTGPAGAGKTAMLDAAAELAGARGFDVVRTCPAPGQPGRLIWAQLLRDVGAPDDLAARLLTDPEPLDLDTAAQALVAGGPRLIVVDDIHHGGDECVAFLAVLAPRVAGAATVVLAAGPGPLGVGSELHLNPLGEDDLDAMVGELPAATRRALWIASRGLPATVQALAGELRALPPGQEPLVHLALHAVGRSSFLEVDATLVRLLETAIGQAGDDRTRARLLARLSAELLGEAPAAPRRRALADEALRLARRVGDPETLAEVLDSRLHALWDPEGAEDRLAAGSEIVELARAAGNDRRERHGLFWRFVALMELGRVAEAEAALAAFEREVALAGDAHAAVMAGARHAMLDILRGRFDDAARLVEEVGDQGKRVGLPDAENIHGALLAAITVERDLEAMQRLFASNLPRMTHRLPGHFYEALAAKSLALLGRFDEAAVELDRVLPRLLAGAGPRWIGSMADAAFAAATIGNVTAAAQIYEALSPYRGRLVVLSGASAVYGPVSHYLGLLASTVGRFDEAVAHYAEAVAFEEGIGALPFLAHSLAGLASARDARGDPGDMAAARRDRERARAIAERLGMAVLLSSLAPPADEWTLRREDGDWLLEAGDERARLRDARGLHYLRSLLSAPARDIPALDLAAGGGGMVAPAVAPRLDGAAVAAYRRRLAALAEELDAADAAGDAARGERLERERQAVIDQLRGATGLAGRPRTASPEAERARVNVTRTLRAAVERIEEAAPKAGAHLRASVRTGVACRYDPAPGGPSRWRV